MGNEIALPYVPIDPRIDKHPKTRKLLRLLGLLDDPDAHMFVVRLLMAVGNLYPDGNLGNLDHEEIADMARWRGDAPKFVAALCDSGWLLFGTGGYVVVGWGDYGGRVHAKRVAFREKQSANQRKRWENQKESVATNAHQTIPKDTKPIPNDTKSSEGEGEGEGEGELTTITSQALEKPLGDEQVIAVGECRGWRRPRIHELDRLRKIQAQRPVTNAEAIEAAEITQQASVPGFAYFVGVLEGNRRPRAPKPTRELTRTVSRQDQSFEEALRGVEAFNATRR